MSQVLSSQKQAGPCPRPVGVAAAVEAESLDYTSNSSIMEFLAKEQDCGLADPDPESIFQEVSRLSDSSDMRSVDELLQEAERLIQQQLRLGGITTDLQAAGDQSVEDGGGGGGAGAMGDASSSPLSSPHSSIRLNTRYTHRIEHVPVSVSLSKPPKAIVAVASRATSTTTTFTTITSTSTATYATTITRPRSCSKSSASPTSLAQTPNPEASGVFAEFVDNLPSESVISEESTPKDLDLDMETHTAALAQLQLQLQDNTDDDEDTVSPPTLWWKAVPGEKSEIKERLRSVVINSVGFVYCVPRGTRLMGCRWGAADPPDHSHTTAPGTKSPRTLLRLIRTVDTFTPGGFEKKSSWDSSSIGCGIRVCRSWA